MMWDVLQYSTGLLLSLVAAGWTVSRLWWDSKVRAEEKIASLQQEKVTSVLRQVEAVTSEIREVEKIAKANAQKLELMVKDIEMRFALLEERIKSNAERASSVTDALRDFVKFTDKRIKNIEALMDSMELVQIGKGTFMVKNRRRDSSD